MGAETEYWRERCAAAERCAELLSRQLLGKAERDALSAWRRKALETVPIDSGRRGGTGRQHKGSIDSLDTMEGRLYRFLLDYVGEWVESWRILDAVPTRVLSTYVSSVRAQLPAGWDLVNHNATLDGKRRDWYILTGPDTIVPAAPGERREAV